MDTLDLIYHVYSEIEKAKVKGDENLVRGLEQKLNRLREELRNRYRTRGNIHSFLAEKKF